MYIERWLIAPFETAQGIHASVSLDTFNSSRVGAALLDGDLLWHVVQVDGALQESSSRSQISLGSEKKVNRIASAINGPVEVLPLTGHFDVGFVHPPAQTNCSFAPPKNGGQHWQHFDSPAMHGRV